MLPVVCACVVVGAVVGVAVFFIAIELMDGRQQVIW